MNNLSRATIIGLALAATLAAVPAFAESMAFKASLSGAEEVPPTNAAGTGAVDLTYDDANKTLTWKGTYSGLTGNPTGAHLHGPADVGQNAGVEVPLEVTASPFEGSAALNDAQAADLLAGKLYLNIHTEANPDGELRGQVTKSQ